MHRRFGCFVVRSSIAAVVIGVERLPAGKAFDLFEGLLEGMTIKGIAVKGIDGQNPVLQGTVDHRHLAAEFVALLGLAFGDAFHFRCVNAAHFVGGIPGLAKNPL